MAQDPSCVDATGHIVATVRSSPSCINFILNWELPVPWNYLFSEEDRWVLRMTNYCNCPLLVLNRQHKYVGGVEKWGLHCHCGNPYSLQCLSAAVIMQKALSLFIRGGGYNNKFLFYREMVNYHCSNALGLVGSIHFRGTHYIYLKCNQLLIYTMIRNSVYFGEFVPVVGSFGSYIIMVCKSCSCVSAETAQKCAERSRRILVNCYRVVRTRGTWRLKSAQECESHRQACLRKFVKYGLPINIQSLKWVSF